MDLWIIQKGSVWYTKKYNFDDIKIEQSKIRLKIGPKIWRSKIGPYNKPKIGPKIGRPSLDMESFDSDTSGHPYVGGNDTKFTSTAFIPTSPHFKVRLRFI